MRFSLSVLRLILFFAPGVLLAQAPAPTPTPLPPIWSGEAGASFVQTTGNSQSRTFGAGLKLLYQCDPWKAEFKSAFIESSANDVESSRKFTAALRGERALGERFAVYGQGSYLRDLFAGIEGQEIAEAGGIYKLLTGPRHSLSVSAGFAYTWEQRLIPPDLNFAGASAGFAYGWKISPTAEFTEEFNYLYDFEDSSDWRVNNAVSVTASITKVLALKLSHQLAYLNSPVPGKKSTDTTVLASLVAKF